MSIVKNKIVKRVSIVVICLIPIVVLSYTSKKVPEGHSPQQADQLALEVMNTLGFLSWEKTKIVKWKMFSHRYQWFKSKDSVIVSWKRYQALINLNEGKGKVYRNGERVKDDTKLVQKAIDNFNNDSFWLAAHFKMLDSGTVRELVDLKDGKTGLKITYSDGGSTPGDTYLWILEDGKPVAWKMWVSIIPFGGVKANWKRWQTTSTGAKIALTHKMLFFDIKIESLETE